MTEEKTYRSMKKVPLILGQHVDVVRCFAPQDFGDEYGDEREEVFAFAFSANSEAEEVKARGQELLKPEGGYEWVIDRLYMPGKEYALYHLERMRMENEAPEEASE